MIHDTGFQPESRAPNLNPDRAQNRILSGPSVSAVLDWNGQDRIEVPLVIVCLPEVPSHPSPESKQIITASSAYHPIHLDIDIRIKHTHFYFEIIHISETIQNSRKINCFSDIVGLELLQEIKKNSRRGGDRGPAI